MTPKPSPATSRHPLSVGGRGLLLLIALVAMPAFASEITPDSVLAGMNAERALAGLPPLRFDARLEAAAADRMRDIEEQEYWAHDAPDGRSPVLWLHLRHYDFRNAGE